MGLYVDNCLQFVDIFNPISTLSVSVSGHFSCLLTAAPREREEGNDYKGKRKGARGRELSRGEEQQQKKGREKKRKRWKWNPDATPGDLTRKPGLGVLRNPCCPS